jgi:hypothetical protein
VTAIDLPKLPAITDRTDKAQIDNYSHAVDTYNDAVDAYNEDVDRYNAEHGLTADDDAVGQRP